MFDRPTKGDIDRALSTLMHEARHQLAARRNEAMAKATKAGALQNSRLIVSCGLSRGRGSNEAQCGASAAQAVTRSWPAFGPRLYGSVLLLMSPRTLSCTYT